MFLALQGVDLVFPRAGSDHAFVLEVAHLHRGVMPVAVGQGVLLAQQVEGGGVLGFRQLVGVLDAQSRLGSLQVQGGIGDVDRAVIGLHAALVGLAIRQGLLLEYHRPTGRRRLEQVGVVHQHVGAPLVGRAEVLVVDHMPCAIFEAFVDVLPVWDQVEVDRLHALASNQAQRGVAGGGHQVVTALGHQADHFVGGGSAFDVDLAAGLLLETGDPVIGLVAFAAFDVARPGNDVELTFAGAKRFERFARLDAGTGQQGGGECAQQRGFMHDHRYSLFFICGRGS